jgi:hypothetical protein
MQTYLFLRIGRLWIDCTENYEDAKTQALMIQALQSSKDVDEAQDLRLSLQASIADRLGTDETLKHLADFSEDARSHIVPFLAGRLAGEKRYEEAVTLFEEFADSNQFPFWSAALIVKKLPQTAGLERRRIFNAALESARGSSGPIELGIYDLGSLVVDCWEYLPESQVNDAIDLLFKSAKADLSPKPLRLTRGAKTVTFDSPYQYRLFQLLPVLKKMDASKAERLIAEEPGMRTAIADYPEGAKSFLDDRKPGEYMSIEMRRGKDPIQTVQRQIFQLMSEHKWQDALESARTLTTYKEGKRVAAMVLLNVASRSVPEAKDVAREAVSLAEKELSERSGRAYTEEALRACEIWTLLKAPDRCDPLLEKAASQLADSAAEDRSGPAPNRAFKGYWPSLFELEGVVFFTCKKNPKQGDEMVRGIKDREMQSIVRLTEARCLLGLSREYWQSQYIVDESDKMVPAF